MPGSGKQPTEIQEQIKELLEAGFDPTTIHRRLKVGRSSIYRMKRCLQQHGTNYMPPEMNKKNGRPKVLTPDQELEVREWLRDPKNRTRYLDDLVWLIHDRFSIVCSTTTMSKLKRKWLRVIEYEETGTPIDDFTRAQLMETHPDLPILHDPKARPAQTSSGEDHTPSSEPPVPTKAPAKKKRNSSATQEQATAGSQQSPSQVEQQPQQQPQQNFLQSPTVQMSQQTSPPQQPVSQQSSGHRPMPTGPQDFSSNQQQQTVSQQQQYSPNQPQMQLHQQQYSPLQQQFSPTQQQLNTSQQAFMHSTTMQMQMQAQMMVGAAQFSAHMDPNQLPHDFQGDFTGDMSTQHLSA